MNSAPSAPAAPTARYGVVSRLFHWLTALMVFLMIPAGIAMTSSGFEAYSDTLFIFHKGTGVVLLVLVVIRLLWRITHAPPPPPPGMGALQARLVNVTHPSLYMLLLLMTVSGYVRVVADGYPIELLDWLGIPALLSRMPELARQMSVLHKFTAYLFTATIAAHTAAAIHHGLSKGDGILGRMWPPFGDGR
jgi:cytochrome b561